MANEMNVDIVATDKTGKGVSSAQKTLRGVQKDLKDTFSGKGTFADFSKNLKSSLGGDKASAALEMLGKSRGGGSILDLAKGLGEATEAAETLAGTMGVLGVATGGVVAGLAAAGAAAYAFSKPWMSGAANVGQLSMALGIATKDLQTFEGAAARMGVKKDAADQAMGGLAQAAHAALYSPGGGEQRAMFGALGIDYHKFADKQGRVDVPRLMSAVSDGIARQTNAQSAAHVAQSLGVTSALPALRQGGGWLRSNMRSVAALGYFSESDAARGMLAAQNDTILGQYRDSQVRRLRGFVAKHGVTQGLDAAAGGLSALVSAPQSQAPLYKPSPATVQASKPIMLDAGTVHLTSPGAVALSKVGVGLGNLTNPVPSVTFDNVVTQKFAPAAGKLQEAADALVKRYMAGGLSREDAVAMAANGYRESKFDPAAVGDSGLAYGLAQWHPDRQSSFAKWSGRTIRGTSLDQQAGFVLNELRGTHRRALQRMDAATDLDGKVAASTRWFEAPKDTAGETAERIRIAHAIDQGRLDIYVHSEPGTRTKLIHQGSRSVRIHHSMDGPG